MTRTSSSKEQIRVSVGAMLTGALPMGDAGATEKQTFSSCRGRTVLAGTVGKGPEQQIPVVIR